MTHLQAVKEKAIQLRKRGYSLLEISSELTISKSTASIWTRSIVLTTEQKNRLEAKEAKGRKHVQQMYKIRHEEERNKLRRSLERELFQFKLNKTLTKLLIAIFIWTEGGKSRDSYLTFINSDPSMIACFLTLLRASFTVDESKLRVLVHVHAYHNEPLIKKYWSEITQIPLEQFNKSYLKTNTGKATKENYKGCIRISYYEATVARELRMLYNMFAKKVIGAW